jgi:hypothetical protein
MSYKSFLSLKEPSADAEPWAWSAYFDDQLRLISEDLLAEGVSFAKLEAEWRRQWRRRAANDDERRQRAFNVAYLREFTPTGDDPAGPCQCGDRVSSSWLGNHAGGAGPAIAAMPG